MHHDIPTTDEILALVEANPGFVVKDYVNSLDWGDLDLRENREARYKYAHGMVIRISRLIHTLTAKIEALGQDGNDAQ